MLLGDANWFAKLSALDPRIAPSRAWFETVRARVVQISADVESEISAENESKKQSLTSVKNNADNPVNETAPNTGDDATAAST